MSRARHLHYILAELIQKRNLAPKIAEQKVFALWGDYLRKHLSVPLSRKTVPVSLSNGVLKIYTEYPAYNTALSLHKPRIIADINAELGQSVLRDLRIEIRPVRPAAPRRNETRNRSASANAVREDGTIQDTDPVPPKQLERIEQTLVDVPDTQLKESLQRLFMTQSKDNRGAARWQARRTNTFRKK